MRIVCVFLLFGICCFAEISGDESFYFVTEGTNYHTGFVIASKASVEDLINISYQFTHLENYTKVATLDLLEEATNWYDVEYRFTAFLYWMHSVYRVRLISNAHRVEFTLIDNKASTDILPLPYRSYGAITITNYGTTNFLVYNQTNVLTKPLGMFARNYVRGEAMGFFNTFQDYIEAHE